MFLTKLVEKTSPHPYMMLLLPQKRSCMWKSPVKWEKHRMSPRITSALPAQGHRAARPTAGVWRFGRRRQAPEFVPKRYLPSPPQKKTLKNEKMDPDWDWLKACSCNLFFEFHGCFLGGYTCLYTPFYTSQNLPQCKFSVLRSNILQIFIENPTPSTLRNMT